MMTKKGEKNHICTWLHPYFRKGKKEKREGKRKKSFPLEGKKKLKQQKIIKNVP